jgi:hypothetical protein
MNKFSAIVFLLLFPLFATAQTARFYADTIELKKHSDNRTRMAHMLEMEWIINGKHFYWGSDTLHVKPDPAKMDTIYFKASKHSKWDTILCNISKPELYTFVYNDCCGGFYLRNERMKRFPAGVVNFRLEGKSKSTYLGIIDQEGIFLKNDTVTSLKASCRSAMSSNIYRVQVQEIIPAKDTANSNMLMCLDIGGGKEPIYDYYYKTKKVYTSFLYMPLDETPLEIIIQTKKRRTIIR